MDVDKQSEFYFLSCIVVRFLSCIVVRFVSCIVVRFVSCIVVRFLLNSLEIRQQLIMYLSSLNLHVSSEFW
jgi:hypothetical protein